MTKRVVMFSGGIGSWAAAKRVAEQYGTDDLFLIFSDVKGDTENPHIGEDEDTYRFIREAAENVGGELVILQDGRNIWQVFHDKKFLGNSRLANCSHELKQKPARKWLEENCPEDDTIVYVGIDWTETHRIPAIERNYLPYKAEAPLCDPPYLDKQDMIKWARSEGLRTPRLYDLGFAHNNCGGGVRPGRAGTVQETARPYAGSVRRVGEAGREDAAAPRSPRHDPVGDCRGHETAVVSENSSGEIRESADPNRLAGYRGLRLLLRGRREG